jgi:hypothetical protein
MSKNSNLQALREHLFDVIERLKDANDPEADPKDTISIESAKAIVDVSKVIVDSAKTEVDFLRIVSKSDELTEIFKKGNQSEFFLTEGNNKEKK